jgi:asparagine synthase (glutamine-hydrolysing)
MCDALTHRGPDDSGLELRGSAGLGMRRLAIIDPSPAGHQPMCNEDGSIWIILNGEVYNFLEMRPALEQKGHRFTSKTDTEVVLHLYEENGADCVHQLRGMFAFAIWDGPRERLMLVRDRLGQKPLYYTIINDSLIFASEIKAILQYPDVHREVDLDALDAYLSNQFVPHPLTMFKDIYQLPPAHILICEHGRIRLERYWALDYSRKLNVSEAEASAQLIELLSEAVCLRMISDVPLGALLSGGVDSSAVVAMMSQASSQPVKTFSIGFEEEGFDELPYARQVAKRYATDHHELVLKADVLNVLPRLVWYYDEPLADKSIVPTFYVTQIARQFVTVALSGDGGDEAFAGYTKYQLDRFSRAFLRLPVGTQEALRSLVARLPDTVDQNTWRDCLKQRLRWRVATPESRCLGWSFFDSRYRTYLYTDWVQSEMAVHSQLERTHAVCLQSPMAHAIDRMTGQDITSYLPDALLAKVDIASMANSLEARAPFLDHRLMEFAASLPADLRLQGSTSKYILKKAMEPFLPAEILYRPKQGFGMPVRDWLRGELQTLVYKVLVREPEGIEHFFRLDFVKHLVDQHVARRANHENRIWVLLIFALWYRMFFQSGQPAPHALDFLVKG